MVTSFVKRYTGLYATPELVGRQAVINRFEEILDRSIPGPQVIFLTGAGGIGKTRLLQQALEQARTRYTSCVAETILDLYHVALHTPLGLIQALVECLTPPIERFSGYLAASRAYNRARLSGNFVEIESLRQNVLQQFQKDLNQLSQKQRIVLALDTIERVVYGQSPDSPLAEAWQWLVRHLPDFGNVVLFVAGRDECRPALEKVKNAGIAVEEIPIGPFTQEESLEFFEKIASLAQQVGDTRVAERLRAFPVHLREGAHAWSGGRPILLSLLIDYLSSPGETDIPLILHEPPPPHITTAEDTRRYEEALFNRLLEGEVGETLIALGRAPKGVDEELLAALLKVSRPEAQRRLEVVKKFSVVKIRPQDQRVFLHDEMYELLKRQRYSSSHDMDLQKQHFEIIREYYRQQREKILAELNERYAPVEVEGKGTLDLETVGKVHTAYQQLLAETMYYSLQYDFSRGVRAYYRFAHEAVLARDFHMDLLLQAELLSCLRSRLDETDASLVELVLESLKLRPLAQAWGLGKYEEGLQQAHQFLQDIQSSWESRFPALLAAAHAWTASLHVARAQRDDLDEGEWHLQQAYRLIEREALEPLTELAGQGVPAYTVLWHKKMVLAQIYRIHGYLKRVKGWMNDAVEYYRKAAVLLREIDLRVGMATVMNDMGFAQAEIGRWHDGRQNVYDALSLRRELGPRVPVGLSLSTLAKIDIREGNYVSARQNAERALTIFNAFAHQRGIGLALIALAEAVRRHAVSAPLLRPEERMELLRQARDHAREAKLLFDRLGEVPRQIEALIEIGCACRDWVWIWYASPRAVDNPERLIGESEEALSQAATLAANNDVLYRHIDALVNLAWLRFYVLTGKNEEGLFEKVQQAIEQAEKAFPEETKMQGQPQLWMQKGKLHTVKGHLEYLHFEQMRKEERKGLSPAIREVLSRVGRNYALSLQYSSRFAEDFQGMRRGKDTMFDRLKKLNAEEMRVVCQAVREEHPTGSAMETFLKNRALWVVD